MGVNGVSTQRRKQWLRMSQLERDQGRKVRPVREGGPASTSTMSGGHRKRRGLCFQGSPWRATGERNSCLFLHLKPVPRPGHLWVLAMRKGILGPAWSDQLFED